MSRARRLRLIVVALALVAAVVTVRLFVAFPVRVAGESMEPTLHSGEVVLVDKLAKHDVARGDLVVFHDPEDGAGTVKRVVGLPGDRVTIHDAVLRVNDRPVEEPYVDAASIDGLYTPTTEVPEDSLFLLGDNRALSIDSRAFGPVDLDEVEGRVVVRLWPLGCPDPKSPCR
jgi:signal peptidase I